MGHRRFAEILAEMQTEHDQKSAEYSSAGDPMGNWREVAHLMRPWKGCYARLTEKYARLRQITSRPTVNPNDLKEVLKELSVYCIMTRILFEEDVEAKS